MITKYNILKDKHAKIVKNKLSFKGISLEINAFPRDKHFLYSPPAAPLLHFKLTSLIQSWPLSCSRICHFWLTHILSNAENSIFLRNGKGTGAEMCPANVFGIVTVDTQSAIGQFFLSVPSSNNPRMSLRKLTQPTFIILSKVANLDVDIEAVSKEQLQAKISCYLHLILYYLFIYHLGLLFNTEHFRWHYC